jgi:carotenoid cleavage dioxygenase
MVAFGYEATGHGSDVVSMFEFTPAGERVWEASIRVPYVGMLHDFAVTERYIVFFVIPFAFDEAQMRNGGIHWSWDATQPTWFGFLRRGGDGSDVRWIQGPTRSATHVMGAFSDNDRIHVDVEMSTSNPFPFVPMRDGGRWNPQEGASHITRLSVDLTRGAPTNYGIEQMYPHVGGLPRQDDRYNTAPYRYGFLACPDPYATAGTRAGACYARFDHQTRRDTLWNAGPTTTLAECCFAPKSPTSREGEGYLMGLATRNDQNGRSDLVILDAERLEEGPVATVMLPMRAPGQVHGWWVREDQLPA